jgi:hypothetical protein
MLTPAFFYFCENIFYEFGCINGFVVCVFSGAFFAALLTNANSGVFNFYKNNGIDTKYIYAFNINNNIAFFYCIAN